jgi:hypothetical protein
MKISTLVLAALACVTPGLQAASIATYWGTLSGANEVPTVPSTGTGQAIVTIDTIAHLLTVDVVFSNLLSPTTASHIHCCAPPGTNAGVVTTTPTFTGFPTGVTSGTYSRTFDLTLPSSWNLSFLTAWGGSPLAAEAVLAAGLAAGNAYLNIHTSAFLGGEIRANLAPVPEPGTWVLMGAALIGIAALRRARV